MNYAATAKKAATMLKKTGTAMTLRVTTPGTYDPATGADSGETTTDYVCVGVLTNVSDYLTDGTLIQVGDKVALIGATVAVRPKADDALVIGGDTWKVVNVKAVEPSGVPVLYKVQVRRG